MRGYLPSTAETKNVVHAINKDQEAIRELIAKKQNLNLELNNYAGNTKVSSTLSVRRAQKIQLTVSMKAVFSLLVL